MMMMNINVILFLLLSRMNDLKNQSINISRYVVHLNIHFARIRLSND